MIKLENVSFKYKNAEKVVLDNISFEVNDGEIVAIVGKNGSGKSTIARLISGINKVKQGAIYIDDIEVIKGKSRDLIFEKIGMVFQNPENQIIFNNIYDELAFSLKDLSKDEIDKRINYALEEVSMLDYKNEDLFSLSLGQKQRIVLAEILAKKPKYIILDEATTMIDSEGKEKIYNIIKRLKHEGFTIVCITNLADEILLADKTLILDNGKIVSEIKKEELVDKAHLFDEYGIHKPTILSLLSKLKENGLDIHLRDYTIKELADALSRR